MKIIALILTFLGIWILHNEISDIQRFQFIDGETIELIRNKSSSSHTYKPLIAYFDKNQNRKEYRLKFSSRPPLFKVGDKVKLLYDETGKKEIRGLLHFVTVFTFPYFLMLIGLAILFFSTNYNVQIRVFNWINKGK